MPNSIEDDEFPMRNPGTGIASSTPIEDDPIPQHQLQQLPPGPTAPSPATQSFASVAQSFRTAAERAEIIDVPQTVPEHPGSPSPQPRTPGPSGPSPEGGGSSGVSAVRSSPARYHRANPSSSNRYSTTSVESKETGDSAGGQSPAANSPPQRKKSTLRSALGKFLRRRKKEGSLSSVSEVDRQSVLGGTTQHRSVSGTKSPSTCVQQPGGAASLRDGPADQFFKQVPPASRIGPTQINEPAKRVASMPIHEFDRALRSHSIGPDDITAIETARNSMSLEAMGSTPTRRRATTATNSRLFTAISGRSRGEEWAGLSPRPASTHGRGSRFTEDDPDEIGRALTSDSGGDMVQKRRSRSLSQLDELASERRDSRRRSDEIRYWRESYDIPGPLSPLSSLPPNENETETEVNDYNFDHGRTSMSIAESALVDRAPKTPPQPFEFGSIASMNEMAGMKITQAATLDERFGGLEARVHKLERVVDQLCHSVPGFKWPFKEGGAGAGAGVRDAASLRHHPSGSGTASGSGLQRVPANQPRYAYSSATSPMIPSIYQSDSVAGHDAVVPSTSYSIDTTDNDSSHMSFGEGRTYIDSLHPPSSSATQALIPAAPSTPAAPVPVPVPGLLRPNSEVTVRPAASMPSLGSSQCSGGEEQPSPAGGSGGGGGGACPLAAQLEAERAARQALEAQVRKLSERMNNLSTTMFAMVRDPAKSKSTERLRPQTAASSTTIANSACLAGSVPANANTNANAHAAHTGRPTVNPSSKAQSIFGKNSSVVSMASSSPSARELGDDEYSEVFQTPREEPGSTPGQQFELFGGVDEFGVASAAARRYADEEGDEDEDEEDLKRKKAARTLSLSQLTMGKRLPTRI